MARLLGLVLLGVVSGAAGATLRSGLRFQALARSSTDLESYTFERYMAEYGREYKAGSAEHARRSKLFEASLESVRANAARNLRERRSWAPGIHPFMDWTAEERQRLHGYKPSGDARHRRAMGAGVAALQTGRRVASHAAAALRAGGMNASTGPAIRNQGDCGSCWAIATAEAVEAQLIKNGLADASVKVSAQAMVDCTPNPQHCGGTGGCDGATGELGLAFLRDHGLPLDEEVQYTAQTGVCKKQDGLYPASGKRVRVSGWTTLPSNKADPLKQALYSQGPAVVAVDANNWMDYDNGIFDNCDKDAILGHAVLAKGFGEEGGKKYWLIQNSWGANWGEAGHIRMLMHDDEDAWCGTDNKPQEGLGCDGGPPEITVCGMCGILYDPLIPEGARLEDVSAV